MVQDNSRNKVIFVRRERLKQYIWTLAKRNVVMIALPTNTHSPFGRYGERSARRSPDNSRSTENPSYLKTYHKLSKYTFNVIDLIGQQKKE